MNESSADKNVAWLTLTVILLAITAFSFYNANATANSEKVDLQGQLSDVQSENEDLKSTIDSANGNIDDANQQLSDAQDNAWSDYETMGQTLEGLSTVDNVSY